MLLKCLFVEVPCAEEHKEKGCIVPSAELEFNWIPLVEAEAELGAFQTHTSFHNQHHKQTFSSLNRDVQRKIGVAIS